MAEGTLVLEEYREQLFSELKVCRVRREARVMIAQAQLQLARERVDDADRDVFWKTLLREIKASADLFVATDVLAAAMADVTLLSIRCGRNSQS